MGGLPSHISRQRKQSDFPTEFVLLGPGPGAGMSFCLPQAHTFRTLNLLEVPVLG